MHEVQPHLAPVSAAVISRTPRAWSSVGLPARRPSTDATPARPARSSSTTSSRFRASGGRHLRPGGGRRGHRPVGDPRPADGAFKEVRLHARIVKSPSGSPQGVTVELEEHHVAPHAGARADAAIQRLLAPRAQLGPGRPGVPGDAVHPRAAPAARETGPGRHSLRWTVLWPGSLGGRRPLVRARIAVRDGRHGPGSQPCCSPGGRTG